MTLITSAPGSTIGGLFADLTAKGKLSDPEKAALGKLEAGILEEIQEKDLPPEEAKLLLRVLNETLLDPVTISKKMEQIANMSEGELGDYIDTFFKGAEKIQARVDEFMEYLMTVSSGDPNVLTAILMEAANEQRRQALEERLNARQQSHDHLMNQAGLQEQSAQHMIEGAASSIALTVVGAAVSFALSAFAVQKTALNTQAGTTDGMTYNTIGQTANSIGGGASQTASSSLQAKGKEDEAAASKEGAESEMQKSNQDIASDVMRKFEEFIRDLVNLFKEMRENEVQAMQIVTKG